MKGFRHLRDRGALLLCFFGYRRAVQGIKRPGSRIYDAEEGCAPPLEELSLLTPAALCSELSECG